MTQNQTKITMIGLHERTLDFFKRLPKNTKVQLSHPGHVCAKENIAMILEVGVGQDRDMLALRFRNGLKTLCQPERIEGYF